VPLGGAGTGVRWLQALAELRQNLRHPADPFWPNPTLRAGKVTGPPLLTTLTATGRLLQGRDDRAFVPPVLHRRCAPSPTSEQRTRAR